MTADESALGAPRTPWLVGLALFAFALPLGLQAFGNGVGSYSMFTQPVLYRVRIVVTLQDGSRKAVPVKKLTPHLGRDARRVVGNATQWFVGETQANLMVQGLDDLAELACQLEPAAHHATVLLERDSVWHALVDRSAATVECHVRGR